MLSLPGPAAQALQCRVAQQSRWKGECRSFLSGLSSQVGFSTCTLSPHGKSPRRAGKMEEGHCDTPDILPPGYSICHQVVWPVLGTARKGH